jgi:hypothetical protein
MHRHFDRSSPQSHRGLRSGEIRFSPNSSSALLRHCRCFYLVVVASTSSSLLLPCRRCFYLVVVALPCRRCFALSSLLLPRRRCFYLIVVAFALSLPLQVFAVILSGAKRSRRTPKNSTDHNLSTLSTHTSVAAVVSSCSSSPVTFSTNPGTEPRNRHSIKATPTSKTHPVQSTK